MKHFGNKTAAITGAASGIGKALAFELAAQGCHLALADINADGLKAAAEALQTYKVRVTTATVDVASRDAVLAFAADTAKSHGAVNLIVNNAGVAHFGVVQTNPIEDYEWIAGINFWGVVHGTQAFLPYLRASGEGHIVNISSVFGLFAQPGMSGYNATKFAVRGFTESLRQELDLMRCGVSATCVHPGGIRTAIAENTRICETGTPLPGFEAPPDEIRAEFGQVFLRTAPEKAARVILRGVRHNKRRVLVGMDAHAIDLTQRFLPTWYQRLQVAFIRYAKPAKVETRS
jgi:short-subunit dehydrogenase